MTHLNRPTLEYGKNLTRSIGRVLYMTLAYQIELSDEFHITPSALMRYQNSQSVMTDLNVLANYDDLIFGGFGYRTDLGVAPDPNPSQPSVYEFERLKILVFHLGGGFDRYRLMLGWDLRLNGINTISTSRNSVEITANIKFDS